MNQNQTESKPQDVEEPREEGLDETTCSAREPALPQEWQDALNEFFGRYATNPTNTQKLNILIRELGDCCVSYMGMSRDTPEQHEAVKVRIMELDYLEGIGLHKPDFC